MRVCVILGHPREGSFNHAIAATVVQTLRDIGYDVLFHDLYAEGFDPILSFEEMPKKRRAGFGYSATL
jgi:putative NADPH-quinone reductase